MQALLANAASHVGSAHGRSLIELVLVVAAVVALVLEHPLNLGQLHWLLRVLTF